MKPSKQRHISYKPAAVARRRTTDTPDPAPEQERAPAKPRPGGGIACQPPADGMDRMLLMIPPGTQYTFTFLGAEGRITLAYPLEGSPKITIDPQDLGKPVRMFYFTRSPVPEFVELGEGAEGAGR